jgi:hypothetical protein
MSRYQPRYSDTDELARCYERLGLARSASLAQVKRAFRRLAFLHHPDRNNHTKASRIRFDRINEAYRAIERDYERQASEGVIGACFRCRTWGRIKKGLDGLEYCNICILDENGCRLLPGPPLIVAECTLTLGLLAAAITCLARFFSTGQNAWVVASLILNGLALGSLILLCLTIQHTATKQELRRARRTVRPKPLRTRRK